MAYLKQRFFRAKYFGGGFLGGSGPSLSSVVDWLTRYRRRGGR